MGDGLGTLINSADALINEGAASVEGRVSHGYFSGDALALIEASSIKQVIVGDGMALRPSVYHHPKVQVIGLAPALAQVIIDISTNPMPNITFATRHTRDQVFRSRGGRFAGPMLGGGNSVLS
jgi:phosphoribosylpyrophosphate synthetase